MLPVKKTTVAWQAAVARRAANDHRTARAPFPVVVTTGAAGGWWWLWVCLRIIIGFRSMEEDAAAHEGSARGPEPLLAEAGGQLLPVGPVTRLEEKNDGRVPQRAVGRKPVVLDADPVRPRPRQRGLHLLEGVQDRRGDLLVVHDGDVVDPPPCGLVGPIAQRLHRDPVRDRARPRARPGPPLLEGGKERRGT